MYYVLVYDGSSDSQRILLTVDEFADYTAACQYTMYHTLRNMSRTNVFIKSAPTTILTRMPPPYVNKSTDNEYVVWFSDLIKNDDLPYLTLKEREQYKKDRALLILFLKQTKRLGNYI